MKNKLMLILALGAAGAVTASAADAKANWDQHCAKCHGTDGAGKTKMGEKLKVKDYTDAKVQAEFKDAELIKATKDGVKEGDSTKMKAYGDVLSDEEIKDLVAFIRKMKK